jgi:pyrroline-5-carboxylate reductase
MRSVGLAVWLDDESGMDTVTALSGSGPAYFFLIMEVMEKAARQLGLPAEQARLLTVQTALGAAKMAEASKLDAATLRQQVTSPGGTTERALKVLMEKGHIEVLFLEALLAAKRRSEELATLTGRPE